MEREGLSDRMVICTKVLLYDFALPLSGEKDIARYNDYGTKYYYNIFW